MKLKTIFSTFLICSLGLFFSSNVTLDNIFIQKIEKFLADYSNEQSAEKIYVHTDRPFYKPGESIWYKAYIRDANNLKVQGTSEVIYVELIKPDGKVFLEHKLLTENGQVNNAFTLSDNLVGGIYKLKAYSQWQKNTNTFFEKEIQIQKVVLPNLRMTLDFQRESYGASAKVIADLKVENLSNQVLRYQSFKAKIYLDGVQQKELELKTDFDGKSTIEFDLPEDLKAETGLLNVVIPWRGTQESIARSIPILMKNIDLQFLPESGDLVEGLETKIAFKALNSFGKYADIAGNIYNQKDELITTFETYQFGMGAVQFTPKTGEQYYAKISQPNELEKTYPLPETLSKGLVINLKEQNEDFVKVQIQSNQLKKSNLILQQNEQIYFHQEIAAIASKEITIPTKKIPTGLAKITLFNETETPLCERLVFLNKHRQLDVQIETNKEKYLPREKIETTITIKDDEGNPIQGNFSMAVVNDQLLSYADDKQANILSSFLLESEIKGKIEEPNFFFDKEEPKADLALDYLLMTQGWRRFDWQEILDNEFKLAEFEKERKTIKGQVVDKYGNGIANVEVISLVSENTTLSDASGSFIFENVNLEEFGEVLKFKKADYSIKRIGVDKYTNDLKICMDNYSNQVTLKIFDKDHKYLKNYPIKLEADGYKTYRVRSNLFGEIILKNLLPQKAKLFIQHPDYPKESIGEIDLAGPNSNLSIYPTSPLKDNQPLIIQNTIDTELMEFVEVTTAEIKEEASGEIHHVQYDKITRSGSGIALDEIIVVGYCVPLIEKDNTTAGGVVTSQQIRSLPTKSVNGLAATVAGVSQLDDGDGLSIKGSRVGSVDYYIDGIRVRGSAVPQSEIDQLQVITGGVGAEYGGGETASTNDTRIRHAKLSFQDEMYVPERTISEMMSVPSGSQSSSGRRNWRYSSRYKPEKIYKHPTTKPALASKECDHCETNVAFEKCMKLLITEKYHDRISLVTNQYNKTMVAGLPNTLDFHINKRGYAQNIGTGPNITSRFNGYYYVNQIGKWIPAKNKKERVSAYYEIPLNPNDFALRKKTQYNSNVTTYSSPNHSKKRIKKGTDKRQTLFWNASIQTDKNGQSIQGFYASDQISTYKITLEGMGDEGKIAFGENTFYTQKEFELTTKYPAQILPGDQFNLPVTLTNNTDIKIIGKLEMDLPSFLSCSKEFNNVTLEARESKLIEVPFEAFISKQKLEKALVLSFVTKRFSDRIIEKVELQKKGFTTNLTFSDTKLVNEFEVDILRAAPHTLTANLTAHSGIVSELLSNAAKMIRQPYGCFEQVSSSNYPNILVMQYLNENPSKNAALINKTNQYMEKALDKLMGYEIKGGGFDWFGKGPAHAGLTAYGLLEFIDMQAVFSVPQDMIDRTANCLQDQLGKSSTRALHSWNANESVLNTYMLYALAKAGKKEAIKKEIEKVYQNAKKTNDDYLLALVTNIFNELKDERRIELANILIDKQAKDGSWMGSTTVTNSGGKNLKVESTALALLALLNSETPFDKAVEKGLQFINSSKNHYGFGSTQATVLSLQAILAYDKTLKNGPNEGTINLYLEDELITSVGYNTSKSESVNMNSKKLSKYFKNGKNAVRVEFADTNKPIPFDLEISYQSEIPASNQSETLAINCKLVDSKSKVGDVIRMNALLQNLGTDTLSNAMMVIGIPSGLSPQPWQLKEIQETLKADYYELWDGKVVFYILEMLPNEQRAIFLDFKADFAGHFESPASYAYLYYDNEKTAYAKPERILIKP